MVKKIVSDELWSMSSRYCNAPLVSAHPTRLMPCVLGVPHSPETDVAVLRCNTGSSDRSRPWLGPATRNGAAEALFLQGSKEALDEPVLLRGIRCRELLGKTIGLHRARVVATAENETVVGAQCQRLLNASQRPQPIDQRFLQRGLSGLATAIVR